MTRSWVVVGICGVTNSGKTTLTNALLNRYPGTHCINQDKYFFPIDSPNHTRCEEVEHNNWELLTAIDMDKMVVDVHKLIERKPSEKESGILVLEGFLLLSHNHLSSLCALKVYMDLDYEETKRRRLTRNYDPPDPPGYFEKVVWPESRKAKEDIFKKNPGMLTLSGSSPIKCNLEIIRKRIDSLRQATCS